MFLVVSAILSGKEGGEAIVKFEKRKLKWLRQFRPFSQEIPSDNTIARVIAALNPDAFIHCFIEWVNEIKTDSNREIIAIDGKI